jgi:hypothetical protein
MRFELGHYRKPVRSASPNCYGWIPFCAEITAYFVSPPESDIPATHNTTHSKNGMHALRRTYAAVRDLQVIECVR